MGLTVREHLVVAHRARVSPHRMWRDMFDPRSLLPPSKAENEKVDGLLELLRLTRVAKAPVAALPLGILRLVEVGRALASDPQVLLLDEPLSGLDIKASENLLGVFRHIVDQADPPLSLILVEHDVAAVLSLSDQVFVLDFGERIAVGTPEQIRQDPAVRAAYLGDSDPPQRTSAPVAATRRAKAARRDRAVARGARPRRELRLVAGPLLGLGVGAARHGAGRPGRQRCREEHAGPCGVGTGPPERGAGVLRGSRR